MLHGNDALASHALQALFDLLPVHVRIADVSGRFQQVNRRVHAGNAFAMQEPPETLRELWEREAPTRVDGAAPLPFLETPGMRALAGRTVEHELLAVRRGPGDDTRIIEVFAAPIRDTEGQVVGIITVDQDVTEHQLLRAAFNAEQREIEELRQRAADDDARLERLVDERSRDRIALQEARSHDRRLSAVGQLAAGVMHDVNNALNPIMAAAYLLRHHAESPEAVREYAERIRMAAETGAATASRVGRFIRQEPVHAGGDEMIDLSVIAREIIDLTEPMRLRRSSASNAVTVASELDAGVMSRGLPGEIREALLNLVQNATDAMPDGGTLTVRTFVEGSEACISIQDNGVGMSPETRDRAFEPFFTTKGSGGTGLGLAEVYGIARRHRGTATIDSEAGEGTAVTLRLPLDRATLTAPAPEPEPVPPVEPLHVLVVEDHDDGREFLRRLLRTEGHTVDTASSVAEARERLAAAPPASYHLMLTDVGLPDGSGWDLAAYARDNLPGLRIGVITGWEPMVSSNEARGAEFVLRKPLRAAELLAHIAGRKPPVVTE